MLHNQRSNPLPLRWKHRVFTTGPQGKLQMSLFCYNRDQIRGDGRTSAPPHPKVTAAPVHHALG